jgi:hypothetical protein
MALSSCSSSDPTPPQRPLASRAGAVRWLAALLYAATGSGGGLVFQARAAEQLQVRAERQGSAVAIEARATIHASLPVIWDTLTDYDHLSRFIPGINASRVVERLGGAAIVSQQGEFHFLFLSFPIDVVIKADEHYPSGIDARSLKGNIKLSRAGYSLQRISGDEGFVLHWTGLVEPQFWTPWFITVPVLRSNAESQFHAMVEEIERREALRLKTRTPYSAWRER